jgi:hypothetical protein
MSNIVCDCSGIWQNYISHYPSRNIREENIRSSETKNPRELDRSDIKRSSTLNYSVWIQAQARLQEFHSE